VARYPDLRELSRKSQIDYSDITSLEQINRKEKGRFERGYPGAWTPEWCALRLRYEEILLGDIRKARKASKHVSTVNEPEAEAAKWAALGNETADRDYQQFAPVDTAAPDVRKHWRKDATDAIG
jgi:hypothetical protein